MTICTPSADTPECELPFQIYYKIYHYVVAANFRSYQRKEVEALVYETHITWIYNEDEPDCVEGALPHPPSDNVVDFSELQKQAQQNAESAAQAQADLAASLQEEKVQNTAPKVQDIKTLVEVHADDPETIVLGPAVDAEGDAVVIRSFKVMNPLFMDYVKISTVKGTEAGAADLVLEVSAPSSLAGNFTNAILTISDDNKVTIAGQNIYIFTISVLDNEAQVEVTYDTSGQEIPVEDEVEKEEEAAL